MAPIVLLLRTVFEAILEVFLLCLAGYVLARRTILDKRTQKQINRLNVSLFTPSLLFSKVAFSLTPAKLRELWIIPIFFAIVTIVSMVVAYVLGSLFRLKKSQRNFAIAASMFMNSNSLPIALMQSLVVVVPNLKWDEDDTKSAMLGRALSYLVMYSTLGMVLRWSYGVHLLSQADPEGSDVESFGRGQESQTPEDRYTGEPETQPLLTDIGDEAHSSEAPTGEQPSIVFHDLQDDSGPSKHHDSHDVIHDQEHPHFQPKVFYSFPNTPTRSAVNLSGMSSHPSSATLAVPYRDNVHFPTEEDFESDNDEQLLLPSTTEHERLLTAPPSSRVNILRSTGRRLLKFLRGVNEFMTVPLWAAALSLIVVLIQPLQHSLDYHMQPVKGALSAAGNCSIPLTLVVLGAYFYNPPSKDEQAQETSQPNGSGAAENVAAARRSKRKSVSSASFFGSIRSTMVRLSRFSMRKTTKEGEDSRKRKKASPGETRTVAIAAISRMIVTPLLLIPLMALGARYDIPKVFDDPVFVVSNVLLISSPPALTLAQITQAASGDAFERLISGTIFWSYCVVTPPATIIYVVVGLLLAQL